MFSIKYETHAVIEVANLILAIELIPSIRLTYKYWSMIWSMKVGMLQVSTLQYFVAFDVLLTEFESKKDESEPWQFSQTFRSKDLDDCG